MKILSQLVRIQLKGLFKGSSENKKMKTIIMTLLYIYLIGYFFVLFGMFFDMIIEPFHIMNLDWLYFALMGIGIILIIFIGSLFVTYGMVYDSKDNELLLSLPIPSQYILTSRLLTLYVYDFIQVLLISIPAIYIYITKVGISVLSIIAFLCVIITLPLFVLCITCLFSYLLGHILIRVNNKNLVTTILTTLFLVVYFMVVGNIQEYMLELIARGEQIASVIKNTLFPIYHMSIGIADGNMVSLGIYMICILVPSFIVYKMLTVYFIQMALSKPQVKKNKYEMKKLKSRSLYITLVERELKHIMSNVNLFLNGMIGVLFCIIGAIALFIYKKDMLAMLTMFGDITPYLCFGVAFFATSNMMTSSIISLEGHTLWNIKVLPVSSKEILLSKILVQLCMTIPSSLILTLSLMINFNLSIQNWLFVVASSLIFNVFVAIAGLVANILLPNFDWRNEVVCVKQSLSSLAGMFSCMAAVAFVGVLYTRINELVSINTYMYIVLALFLVIDIILYYTITTWGVKKFESINA